MDLTHLGNFCYQIPMPKAHQPRTLRAALEYFSVPDRCLAAAATLRWPGGVRCPGCGSKRVRLLATRQIWKCEREHPGQQFSIKVGTIFEDSPIPIDKWLGAIWMIANRPEETSAHDFTRVLGVTPKTAWYMLDRIQLAMNTEAFGNLAFPPKLSRAKVVQLPRRHATVHS